MTAKSFSARSSALAVLLLATATSAGAQIAPTAPQVPTSQPTAANSATDTARFGQPVDDILASIRYLAKPEYLKKANVETKAHVENADTLVLDLYQQGRLIGRHVDKLIAIDADRTRIEMSFTALEPAAIAAIAKPIVTDWTPAETFVKVHAEFIGMMLDHRDYNPSILKKGTAGQRELLNLIYGGKRRTDDKFELNDSERQDAAIRRAYRFEAQQAGPNAPNL